MSKPRRRRGSSIFDIGDVLASATEDMLLSGTRLSSRSRMLEDMDAGALLELLGEDRAERAATITKLMKNSSEEDIAELVAILSEAVSKRAQDGPTAP